MSPGDCKHFLGIQNTCGAGIDPKTVRDSSGKGPYRWPCLPSSTFAVGRPCTTTCAKFEAVTQEEADEDGKRWDEHIARFAAGLCPTCGEQLMIAEDQQTRVKSCAVHGFVGRECFGRML